MFSNMVDSFRLLNFPHKFVWVQGKLDQKLWNESQSIQLTEKWLRQLIKSKIKSINVNSFEQNNQTSTSTKNQKLYWVVTKLTVEI